MFKGQHHESRKSLSLLLTLELGYCKKSQLLRGTFCFTQVQGPNALTTLLHLADDLSCPSGPIWSKKLLHTTDKKLRWTTRPTNIGLVIKAWQISVEQQLNMKSVFIFHSGTVEMHYIKTVLDSDESNLAVRLCL